MTRRWLRSRRLWTAFVLLLLGMIPTGMAVAQEGPTVESLASSISFVWVMFAGVLVFFMQAGFALLEAGSTRSRNAGAVFMKNLMDFCMCGLAYWAFGFALMFGGSALAPGLDTGNDFFGSSGFFLSGDAGSANTALLWFFQMVFAATAATIVSGAVAERTRLDAYMAYSFLISAIVYPIYGHWVWGGGWLAQLGAWDFAGSGVVHAVGGVAAFVGAKMVGPRTGKFDAAGKARSLPGHNMGYVVLGTMILFVGWFGFNPGSTLNGNDPRIAVIAVNTFLAGITGGVVAYYYRLVQTGKADVAVTCSGIIAGLVGITAGCAFVDFWAAIVIGAVAGLLVIWSAGLLERVFKVDDPVWAVACHGVCGLWGLLALGIFANGDYLEVAGLVAGGVDTFVAQLVSMAVVVVWSGLASVVVFGILRATTGLRVAESDEVAGLDVTEFVQPGYVYENA
ncbi:MAG: ammonium transporter [Actinobacteria bacterium]|nr:ammonium transporter [Actinomycetota bacterium]MCI0544244.1 ammonium transporter [Actinomycetota bacterium]